VWLLADEWTPISPTAEETLATIIANSASSSLDEIAHRFRVKAVLHSMIRLMLILNTKGEGPWRQARCSMIYDHVGVSLPHVNRLCRRAQIWAQDTKDLQGLSNLFADFAEHAAKL
jgi:hypothetical protein